MLLAGELATLGGPPQNCRQGLWCLPDSTAQAPKMGGVPLPGDTYRDESQILPHALPISIQRVQSPPNITVDGQDLFASLGQPA